MGVKFVLDQWLILGLHQTKNANYVVKQLPSLPQQIRAIKTGL